MNRHSLLRICFLIILLLVLAGIVYGFSQILSSARLLTEQHKQQAQITVAQPEGQNLTNTDGTLEKTPFVLALEHKEVDNITYTTFSVYRMAVSSESRLYICGRQFETSLLRSISWAGDSYDIIVTYKNGQQLVYGFDGKDGWQ